VYAQDTDPPVPAVAENEWVWTANAATTFAVEVIVAIVGDVVRVEQMPVVHVQPVNALPESGVAVTDIWVLCA
jgi:hypothetical protein